MTLNSKLPKFFTSSPNEVAKDIYNAVIKKKNIIYTMKIWRLIMFIIKSIPEGILKKNLFKRLLNRTKVIQLKQQQEK